MSKQLLYSQRIEFTRKLGSRISKALKEKGIKSKDIAKEMGVNKALFSRYKTGKTRPPGEVVQKIATITGKPMEYFYHPDEQEKKCVREEAEDSYETATSTQNLLRNVTEILESGNKDIVDALTGNIKAFLKSVRPDKERRKSRRFLLVIPVQVTIFDEPESRSVIVLNASDEGLHIQSTHDMSIGEKIQINVSFIKDSMNENLKRKAEIIWKNKQCLNGDEGWRYGVKFSDVLDESKVKLSSLFQK